MLTRLTHAGIAFAAMAILYQAYVLAIVPFIEPQWRHAGPTASSTSADRELARAAPERYRAVLAAYFPAEHWCFARPPKIFENGQAMIVLDDYEQSDNGQLAIAKCAIIFFPQGRDRGAAAPRDAIILEPSRGAVLQMDQKLNHGAGGFGRMQFGELRGEVIVRSDMREPGPQDDLLIATRNLYMNEDLIRTTEPVELRLGNHVGRGRELDIRFMQADPTHSDGPANIYGRLDSLEISHEVSAVIAPGPLKLHGGGDQAVAGTGSATNAAEAPSASNAPIRIQSQGPFRIQFSAYVASFHDDVQVRQLHSNGDLDELQAEELTLYFTRARGGGKTAADDGHGSFALAPETIEAKGTPEKAVRLTAPSYKMSAVGERLRVELTPRQISLERGEGRDEVTLTYEGGEIHAPSVRYQMPPKDSNQRVGNLAAKGGPGRLRAVLDATRPEQALEVSWKDSLQVVRRNGQPVLLLDGRPQVSMIGVGRLWADRIELFLKERSEPVDRSDDKLSLMPSSVVPVRLTAATNVAIESARLNGRTNQLDLNISYPSAGSSAGSQSAGGATQDLLLSKGQQAERSYNVSGIELKADIEVRDRKPAVTGIRLNGAVVFQETTAATVGEPPLRIAAERLSVAHADGPAAEIEISGMRGPTGSPLQMAEIASAGAILRAPAVTLKRGSSQAWINSPGELVMRVDRDATGKPLPKPQPVTITWQESMKLDRDAITFTGDVRVLYAAGWLHTRRLVATLSAPISFESGQTKPQLARLACFEGAIAEFDQRDELTERITAHQRIEVQSLSVDQGTGAIAGDGPGHVDSVHLGSQTDSLLAAPGVAAPLAPQPARQASAESLRRLSIDFLRGIEGNINIPQVRVIGDVKTIYGEVDSWDQKLVMTPGGKPEPHTIWVQCDDLSVAQSPAAPLQPAAGERKFGPIELMAVGAVIVEGQDPRQGAFTMRGHRARYDQAKTMFVLEGDGRQPATIYHQQYPGAPLSPQSAQKMIYWQNTGNVEVQLGPGDKIQLHQFDLGGEK